MEGPSPIQLSVLLHSLTLWLVLVHSSLLNTMTLLQTTVALLCLVATTTAFSVTSRTFVKPSSTSSSTALGPVARNGLVYEDVEIGSGRRVNAGDTVLCYYEGSYKQGSGPFSKSVTFDATEPGEPVQFLVGKGQLIDGMDTGICGDLSLEIPPMNIGGDRKLKIPSDLAYGEQGAGGGAIPPNQDLEFQIAIVNAEKQGGVSMDTRLKGYAAVAAFATIVLSSGWFVLHNI